MEFLTFHIGEREFAVDLRRVREIVAPPWITRVPGMPPALLGLVGLRGDPTAVVDAGLRLAGRAIVRSARSPLIVLRVEHQDRPMEVGLLVEAAGRKLELDSLLPWTDELARFVGSDACEGFADVEGQLVIVLDVDRLLSFGRMEPRVQPPAPPIASPPDRRLGEAADPHLAARTAPAPATPPSPPAAAPTPQSRRPAPVALQPPSAQEPRWPVGRAAPHAPQPAVPVAAQAAAAPSAAASTAAPARAAFAHGPPPHTDFERGPAPHAEFAREEGQPTTRSAPARLGWIAVAAAVLLALIAGVLLIALSPDDRRAASPARPIALAGRRAEPAPGPPAASSSPAPIPAPIVQPMPPPPRPAEPAPAPAPPARPEPAALPPAAPAARPPHRVPEFLAVTPQTPACEIHEVKRGDTLWGISARRLGDPYRWPQVFGENRDHLFNPDLIEVDDRIRIPGACAPAGVK